jgi:hypothetical protein
MFSSLITFFNLYRTLLLGRPRKPTIVHSIAYYNPWLISLKMVGSSRSDTTDQKVSFVFLSFHSKSLRQINKVSHVFNTRLDIIILTWFRQMNPAQEIQPCIQQVGSPAISKVVRWPNVSYPPIPSFLILVHEIEIKGSSTDQSVAFIRSTS